MHWGTHINLNHCNCSCKKLANILRAAWLDTRAPEFCVATLMNTRLCRLSSACAGRAALCPDQGPPAPLRCLLPAPAVQSSSSQCLVKGKCLKRSMAHEHMQTSHILREMSSRKYKHSSLLIIKAAAATWSETSQASACSSCSWADRTLMTQLCSCLVCAAGLYKPFCDRLQPSL